MDTDKMFTLIELEDEGGEYFALLKRGDFARAFRGKEIDVVGAILLGEKAAYKSDNEDSADGSFNRDFLAFLSLRDNHEFYRALFTMLKQGEFPETIVRDYMSRKILSNFSGENSSHLSDAEKQERTRDIQSAFNEVFPPTIQ